MRLHRGALATVGVAAAASVLGCSDSTPPKPLVIPAFVVVGDTAGTAQLYRVENGVVTRLAVTPGNDTDPRVAAGRIVFSSDRDANVEIYIEDTLASVSRRVTTSNAQDDHPALSPDGSMILFVSNRSGAPRLWLVPAPALDAVAFDVPTAVATGSDSAIPEGAPVWSADGSEIAFTSTRTGASQVFTLSVTGGEAVQVTNEVGGAFNPEWSADGKSIYYLSTNGSVHLRRVKLSTGSATDFATDSLDLDAASCDATACISAEDPRGGRGSVLAFPAGGGKAVAVIPRTRNEREAAIIVP